MSHVSQSLGANSAVVNNHCFITYRSFILCCNYERSHRQYINEYDSTPGKVYLWTPKSECHTIFTCHEFFFQLLKNLKIILSSWGGEHGQNAIVANP